MKRTYSVPLILLAVLLVVFIGWFQGERGIAEESKVRDGMLIHISKSTEDPHRALMPLTLAMKLSDAYDVQLFLDIDAIYLLTKDGPNLTYEGFDLGSKELVAKLLEKGVHIDACPMCMKSHGVVKEDLVDGVRIATAETFNGFTEGRIITMDW